MAILTKEEVQKVLEQHVAPQLATHGGTIRLESVEDNIVRITLWGNCQGCPSAQLTTETIVFEQLRENLGDKVKDVILVNEVSSDVLNFAKKLLSHEEKGE